MILRSPAHLGLKYESCPVFSLDHEKIAVTNTELWFVASYIGSSSIPESVLIMTSFSTFV